MSTANLNYKPLSTKELTQLYDFLAYNKRKAGGLNMIQLDALVMGIICGGSNISTQTWQGIALGQEPHFTNKHTASDIGLALTRYFNQVSVEMNEGKFYPRLSTGAEKPNLFGIGDKIIESWSRWFLNGFELGTKDTHSNDTLLMFAVLAGEVQILTGPMNKDRRLNLQEIKDRSKMLIPDLIEVLYMDNHEEEVAPPEKYNGKVLPFKKKGEQLEGGDFCSCGSGLKHENCCAHSTT